MTNRPAIPPASRAAVWALVIIFSANFLNYLDRQLVSALEEPLSESFHLNARQHGNLWALFTVGYMICAIPIGPLADRVSRTRLFAICVVIWSVATIATGMAMSRQVLYIARVFIGVGEAGCLVIGPALISDLFPLSSRGRALSIFYLGMPLGGTAAFIFTGLLSQIGLGWRELFFLAGVPGFLIAALIWIMADPPRGTSEGAHHDMHSAGLKQYLVLLRTELLRTKTLLLVILAQAFAVIILVPLIHFGVRFFVDTRGLSKDQALIALGVMALVAGSVGTLLSGIIGDKLAKRMKGAYALLAGISFLAGWPCLLVGFIAPDPWVFLPSLTLGAFFIFMCMPAVNTQIANVTSPAQRGTAWALAVFISHLLGDTAAPPLFGWVVDRIPRQQGFVIFSSALGLAGLCCLVAVFTAQKDVARVSQLIEKEDRAPGSAG